MAVSQKIKRSLVGSSRADASANADAGNDDATQCRACTRSTLPMGEWDTEQVLAWCAVQLPEHLAGALATELEDGEELAGRKPRSLLKLLKRHGATEAEAETLLARRDAVLAEQQRVGGEGAGRDEHTEEAPAVAVVEPCDICFEPFDRRERTPRLLKECGHTFCASTPTLSWAWPRLACCYGRRHLFERRTTYA